MYFGCLSLTTGVGSGSTVLSSELRISCTPLIISSLASSTSSSSDYLISSSTFSSSDYSISSSISSFSDYSTSSSTSSDSSSESSISILAY